MSGILCIYLYTGPKALSSIFVIIRLARIITTFCFKILAPNSQAEQKPNQGYGTKNAEGEKAAFIGDFCSNGEQSSGQKRADGPTAGGERLSQPVDGSEDGTVGDAVRDLLYMLVIIIVVAYYGKRSKTNQ